jgi:2-polyprenyl-6-hydroxyphenyl methylase/3-demethylubiquinone-9 3-methyltransferase
MDIATSIMPDEVARFDALAARWWDRSGPMAPLHAMNPLRVAWVDRLLPRGCLLLDVGCGAGLASEALARLGHDVLGIDAGADVIAAAELHAQDQALTLRYRHATAESLLDEAARFDAVTALEVVEHVADPARFIATLAGLLAPGGTLVLSTLNRTRRSYLTAKLGAEYLLRLLPVGTHQWQQFITPAELGAMIRSAGLLVTDTAGMSFNPLFRTWHTSRDTSVNYIMAARKAA